MKEAGFEFKDHTADVSVRSWGKTLEEAFSQTANRSKNDLCHIYVAKMSPKRHGKKIIIPVLNPGYAGENGKSYAVVVSKKLL